VQYSDVWILVGFMDGFLLVVSPLGGTD